jgi:hypothetical protein
VPAQQLSDDVSNVALRRTGPGLVKQAGWAGLQRSNGWPILWPVRLQVEDVAKFLMGEAMVAHAAPRSCE